MSNEANFETLLKLSGLKKYELAAILGVTPSTVGNWKSAAPKHAVAYLQLYVDLAARKEELRKAYNLVGDFADLREKQREAKKAAEQLLETFNRKDE